VLPGRPASLAPTDAVARSRHFLLLLLALPLAVALGWWLRPAATPSAPSTDDEGLASLQAQLAAQRRDTDARLARIERLLADRAVAGGAAAPAPSPAERAALKEQVRQRAVDNRARLEQAFTGAGAGTVAPDAERRVNAVIASSAMRELTDQPVDTEVRCRSRMCAIRVVFAAGADAEMWTSRLALHLAPHYGNGRIAVMQTPHGDIQATLYTVPPGNEGLLDLR
jgi:hypothetical protein